MAIVAVIGALILLFLAGRQGDQGVRRLLYIIAGGAGALALYLILFEPDLAWDMRSVGRLVGRFAGHGLREMLR